MRASHWLAVTLSFLPVPADRAIARAEQLLADADGDPWAEADLLKPLCVLYAIVGRAADARAAIDRSQSNFASFGAGLALAEISIPAALACMILGDPAAAEHYARDGYEACLAMGQRGEFVADLIVLMANAVYEQDRFDEAQRLIDEARARAWHGGFSPSLTEAKLLARRGQVTAARQLLSQAEVLRTMPSSFMRADVLKTRAEVERLAGLPDEAAASLRAALQIYEQTRATALAQQVRTALANLAAPPGPDPA